MRIPSAGTPVSLGTLIAATLGSTGIDRFADDLSRYLDVPHVRLSGSGTSALYGILSVLAKRSGRREVVLPSYTAPSLVLPIRKAGLTPVLAEMSEHTLNADSNALLDRVTEDTLAVMPVHMYGLASDTDVLANELRQSEVYTIEDACSSHGTVVSGRQSGTWCDIGFYSFNRGKNMATLSGGAFSTSDTDLANKVETVIQGYPASSISRRARNVCFSWALAAAVRPIGYTALYPLVSKFKYTELHTDFAVSQYSHFQARIGSSLLDRFDCLARQRSQNAAFIRNGLRDVSGVCLPDELEGSTPVYNQCPILLSDSDLRERVHTAIVATGLEATLLYPEPVHRVYKDIWDGSGDDPYPVASAISQRILLVPVHPLVPRSALERVVEIVIREVASSSPASEMEAQI
jgi:perosamine synthetase